MRPPVRLLQPLEAPRLHLSKTLYVCSNCRYDGPAAVSQQHQTRRHAGSGSTPFTEKLRRRIWGTENPPGLEDPYGGEGLIAKAWKRRKAKYAGEKEDDRRPRTELSEQFEEEENPDMWAEDDAPSEPFEPATTAHNLKRMGYVGEWSDFEPTEGDEYYPFVSRRKARTSPQFHRAAQSVAVELCILHELKKPLSLACEISEHHKTIWTLIEHCRIAKPTNPMSFDNIIKFPNEKIKKKLFYVFNQLGENTESQSKKNDAETSTKAISENEETQSNTAVKASAEEGAEVDESEPAVQNSEVYSFALNAKKTPAYTGYLNFPLADPAVKFAFIKRFSQVTGHYISDSNASTAKTVREVVEHFEQTVCPPKKLFTELRIMKTQQKIPNLKLSRKRYTKQDEDRELGRAKIIEQALRERGLMPEDIKPKAFRL